MKKCNQWMFEKVRCKGYMKKVKDGRCIIKYKREEMPDHQEHYFYEYGEIGTEAKEIDLFEECALVYYGCNKSRLIPVEDLEIIKEG